MSLSPALKALEAIPRWVNYTLEPDPDRPGKTTKRPLSACTGLFMAVTDASQWASYAEANAKSPLRGFVFHDSDDIWFLDIDGCLVNGDWSPAAKELCAQLNGAAVEVSQSGTGLHIFGRGRVPPHSSRNIAAGIELYTTGRFVALTDAQTTGNVDTDHTAAITDIVHRYFPPNKHGETAGWSDQPREGYEGPFDDAELLRAAIASGKRSMANAFGDGVTFEDLWTANADKLGKKWPSAGADFDHSMADASLASHLAYWTGCNNERTRELMLQSELARDKWELRPDWLELTIVKASSVVTNMPKARELIAAPAPSTTLSFEQRIKGREFMGTGEQLAYFNGCVYVTFDHKVWIPSTGALLDKPRFDVQYGGFVFAMDDANEKVTDSAFDCFTRSKSYKCPRADRLAFRPECPPGGLIIEDGWTLVNSYIPVMTRRERGPVDKFLLHLQKLFPEARDRDIFLHFLASMVQNLGFKAQWWCVIVGAEGNGKSLFTRLMSYCLGMRYSHLVNPSAAEKSGNQFNDWISEKLFVSIEEIHMKGRRDFLEAFKTTVTDDRIAIEGKGLKQTTGDNRCNGILNSNHLDAIPITTDARRYSILYCAQQSYADILRDGMGGRYFPDLYDWLAGRGEYASLGANYGLACVNEYLHTFELRDEFNPARDAVRAPLTSSHKAALAYGMGAVEQEVVEAVEQGREGFAGGWISSVALDRLLDVMRVPLTRTKRRDMLLELGYVVHPALEDGRVSTPVKPDNAKPRLYVRAGHLSLQLTDPALIAKAYTAAQATGVEDKFAATFGHNKSS